MPNFVALLRGVNVGSANRIAMSDLRTLLTSLGYGDPVTLLNSGNAVFGAAKGDSASHASRIRRALVDQLGLSVAVYVKSAREWDVLREENTLLTHMEHPSRLMVAVVHERGELRPLQPLLAMRWEPEALALGRHAAYAWCPDGFLASRLMKSLMKLPGEGGTTRNWATVEKIAAALATPPRTSIRARP